jgi:hypothetical protein
LLIFKHEGEYNKFEDYQRQYGIPPKILSTYRAIKKDATLAARAYVNAKLYGEEHALSYVKRGIYLSLMKMRNLLQ